MVAITRGPAGLRLELVSRLLEETRAPPVGQVGGAVVAAWEPEKAKAMVGKVFWVRKLGRMSVCTIYCVPEAVKGMVSQGALVIVEAAQAPVGLG